MNQTDDLDLIAKVARGDEGAFLSLYDRYSSHVFGLVQHMLQDSMLAEEITQDTFLKLWGRARQYLVDRGSLLGWLLTIARHTALDRVRLEGRRPLLSDGNDPEDTWENLADGESLPEENRWRTLRFAVQALPADQRQVIELAYFQGLSQSEIAAELGWPLGTVKTRIRSGMEALREVWLQNS